MKKVTLKDVAREAGLGTATVERVINGRGGVSEKTAEKVTRAVKRLKYGVRDAELHRSALRIEVILVRPETSFFARLNRAFERIAASLDRAVLLHRTFVKENDPAAMARHIASTTLRRSGLIICAQDDPAVKQALRAVMASGVVVVQIVTRCDDGRLPYVGIDNYAAGRTAAYYMSGLLAAKAGNFVAICHSGTYKGHRDRIQGFSDYLAERGSPNHVFLHAILGQDDDLQIAELLAEALRRDPNIIGVYSAGGGDEGVAAVLQKWSRMRDIFWVGHELTHRKQRYLRSDLMNICIDQAPEVQARRSVDMVLHKLEIIPTEINSDPVRFLTITRENV
ncbi:LacI family DNA-binding transcriptional regulator [Rhizobium cauense]|uniref:LacI family DNA-binding transcriptional regulator n=1 Tax=Rhizobium cauense TaxID=1166683 RepID=UPI001C6EC9D0|nr:LacI family DNA-binding transcriptional regulator [Rhizobium cauense]MBW9113993.1 LacI family DNA-binding transcriptional regulator [Rhizobium cauense]